MDHIIYFNYTNPLHPTAFGSINTVAKFYKPNVPLERVKAVLLQNTVYTSKRREKKVKHHVPIYAYYKFELIQIDLLEVRFLARSNSGIHYIFMAYDTASKYGWCIPLKNKKMITVSKALDDFFSSLNAPVRRVLLDRGSEFSGILSRNVFEKHGVVLTWTLPSKHAYGVERLNQSFQHLLYKFLSSRKNNRFIDHLQDLMDTYNSRTHRIIQMQPRQALLKKNAHILAKTLFEYYGKNVLRGKKKQKKSKLFVDDLVHLKLERKTFTRGYNDHYSKAVYKIVSIDISKHIPLYTLKSTEEGENNILPIKYYEENLLKVGQKLDDKNLNKIPAYDILEERTNKSKKTDYLIKWRNISDEYIQWVPKDLLLSKEVLTEK